jgi:hypothetical protein
VLPTACIPIALIGKLVSGIQPAVSSYQVVWNPILLNLLDKKLAGHTEEFCCFDSG